jgi:hypothetical protein
MTDDLDVLAAEERRYLEAYEAVREKLLRIAGVVDVGVGLKETAGDLTGKIAYRVYVQAKRPQAELSPEAFVPTEIDGFRTDVITKREQIPVLGFNDENDERNYKVKVAGIYVGNDKLTGTGTLGCFCRRTTDNKVVFLSCHHVLFDGGAGVGSEVGQPQYDDSCCCTCNKIGAVLDGDKTLDCAISSLDDDVPFITKVKQIKRADGTLEHNGFISGSDNPQSGHEVWKIGARTGLTRGTISQVAPDVEIHPKAPFAYIADHGDSGSVVVDLTTGMVVGLLKSIDKEIAAGGTLGFATPIGPVLTKLKITVSATDASQTYDVALSEEYALDRLTRVAPASGFADVAQRLRASEAGVTLLERLDAHRAECVRLVNTCRPVTVAWHRSESPAFMAALARSAKVPEYRIPYEIDGVSRAQALLALRSAFERNGSDELRTTIAEHGDRLLELLLRCETVDELIDGWEASEPHVLNMLVR